MLNANFLSYLNNFMGKNDGDMQNLFSNINSPFLFSFFINKKTCFKIMINIFMQFFWLLF